MRALKAAVIGAALGLAGCVDVDVTTEVLGPDLFRVTGATTVQVAMLEMMGGAETFCPEGEGQLELVDNLARCHVEQEGSAAQIFQADEGPAPTAQDLGDGTVRVVFPLAQAFAEVAELREDPTAAQTMLPLVSGHALTFRVAGREIVSSNGEIAADGRSASYRIALESLFDPETVLPEAFETVVRY